MIYIRCCEIYLCNCFMHSPLPCILFEINLKTKKHFRI